MQKDADWAGACLGCVKQRKSILQVCQLTELKQTKEWEVYSNRFRHLYETLLPENVGKYYRKRPTGQMYLEIKLLI